MSTDDRAIPRLTFLSESQLDRIHDASLQILERPGMRVMDARARTLLAGAGCLIDDEDVSFPRDLVEWSITVAPGDFIWHGRDGDPRIVFDGSAHWGAGVTCLNYLDPATRENRPYTLDDIAAVARLTDALPNIDFLATPGVVRSSPELPQELVNQHEFLQMASNATTPFLVLIADVPELADILEMAAVIAGGREALRERPFVAPYLNPVSPGLYNPETVGKLLLAAEWGVPVVCQPAPQVGATSPVTLAGAIALSNAESLAGLVIAQLVREGTPYITGVVPMALDMRNGAAIAAGPVTPLMQLAAVQLARRYGIPMLADGGSSDAKIADEQSTLEAAYYAITSALTGVDLMFDGGCLEGGLLWSPELLTIVDEIADLSKATTAGIEVTDEALAIDVIREVGIGDIYLGHDHTLAHFREMWLPRLISWEGRTDWQARGATTLGERVRERTNELLATHQAPPLPDDVVASMLEVIEARRLSLAATA
jgi:trimethylamine---corrinoid protein Co-methyltransferase